MTLAPVKILHISDAHLGRAQYQLQAREEDYYRALEDAVRLGRGADAVLITGDLFDSRRPPVRSVVRFVEAVREIGVPIYVVGGNHDFSYVRYRAEAGDCQAQRCGPHDTVLSLLDRLGVIRLLCWEAADAGGVHVFGACATPRAYAGEYKRALQKAPPNCVLAIHQAIEGVRARYPAEADEYTMPVEVFRGVRYLHIAAGHVHDHMLAHPVGAVWAGSLELWDAGEFETWNYAGRFERVQSAAQKGAVLLDIAGRGVSVKSIPLPARRPMYRLRLFVRDKEDLLRAIDESVRAFDRDGAVIRIEIWGAPDGGVRAGQIASAFSRALYVDAVYKSAPRREPGARGGAAYEELWRLVRERLGGYAETVIKAMELLRDGNREGAYRLIMRALYEQRA